MERPQTRGLIVARSNEKLPIRAECDAVHRLRMPAKFRDQFSVQRVPHSHGVISTGSHDKLAIRSEERSRQWFRVATQLCDELPVGCPQTSGTVAATGHDHVAVRTETYTGNVSLMTTQPELHLAGSHVPNSRREITPGQSAQISAWATLSCQKFSIRAESECCLCASQAAQCYSLVTIKTPNHPPLIRSRSSEVSFIGTERDLTDGGLVAQQSFHGFASSDLPHPHCVVVACAYKIIPIRTENGAMHLSSMTLKLAHECSVAAVPDSHYAVRSRSDDQLAVTTERCRVCAGPFT